MTAWVPTTPDWVDYPSTTTAIDATDLDAFNAGLIATNDDWVVLYHNGTTYVTKSGSTTAKGAVGKPKYFVGTPDPATVSGVVFTNGLDRWDQIT